MDVELVGVSVFRGQLTALEKQMFPKAFTRAINSTARTVRARTIKSVAKHMGVNASGARRRMKLRRARVSKNPVAKINVSGKALNLASFKARQVKRGVSAAPWNRRRIFPHAFITKINGKRLVMVRRKRGGERVPRLPIRSVLGPGVAKSTAREEMQKERQQVFNEEFPKRLRQELAYLMRRVGG